MTGEPIGVLPTRAIDHKAVTWPRYSGAEASWIVALPVVRKMTLATPTCTHAAIAVRALMLLLGLSWAQALVPLQAAAFATITPAATGAASTLFNTGRQLGAAVGVAILTTVASAVGLTQQATGRAVTPHLAAYHAGLVTASVIALIAAIVSQLVDDRAAAATMRSPKPPRRDAAAATHAAGRI
jgi:hypothetical protein